MPSMRSSTSCHFLPLEKIITSFWARSLMVSSSCWASSTISFFRVSICSSLNCPSITFCSCSATRSSAVFILPNSLGMMMMPEPAASSRPKLVAIVIRILCSLTSESSSPALPFERSLLARLRALASASYSVGALNTQASAPIRGMGRLISYFSPALMSGMGLYPRSGTGPVCTRPKVCSSRAVSCASGVMSPQRMRHMFEAT